jgi:hypothetical protein
MTPSPAQDAGCASALPVHNSPRQVDGSDADEIGLSALSVRKSGTPPFGVRKQLFAKLEARLR